MPCVPPSILGSGEITEAHVLKTPSRMSQTKSKRLISDFRESILPTGPHNGVETQLMRQLRRLQRSTMCSPLDPPAECPATGSLRARWEPRTGVRSLGSHRRYPSRRPFRRAASREEQVLPLRGSGWITIFRAAKCNPCVCLKCHPCLCPLPTPTLSPLRGEGVGSWPQCASKGWRCSLPMNRTEETFNVQCWKLNSDLTNS